MANTLILDISGWDLLIDASGNIAMASQPYSQAQDAASAIRTFRGESWYNVLLGVPYWDQILGKAPPLSLIKAYIVEQALTVPGVASAVCYINSFVNRRIGGQVQLVNQVGQTISTGF